VPSITRQRCKGLVIWRYDSTQEVTCPTNEQCHEYSSRKAAPIFRRLAIRKSCSGSESPTIVVDSGLIPKYYPSHHFISSTQVR
jgi:hypothetical protein